MPETDKTPDQLLEEVERLKMELDQARKDGKKLKTLQRRYVEMQQSIDIWTREVFAIRSLVNMPQLYLDDDLRIVGHSADFVRQTTKIIQYAREGTHLNVLLEDSDVESLREYIGRVRALEDLPYGEGEPWQLKYKGPGAGENIGREWISHSGDCHWKLKKRGGGYAIYHEPHPDDHCECCLMSELEYGGPAEDVRLVFKTRTAVNTENICDNTCFISASSGREAVVPDINGYTACLGSNFNTVGRIQKQGADVVSRHERLEPDTEYLVEVERIGGRITRRVVNVSTGEEMPLLYYIDCIAIYDRENHIGFYTYSGEAEFYDIEIYTRPSRFSIDQFSLPFVLEVVPRGHGLENRCFELKIVRNEIMDQPLHTLIFNDITTRKLHESKIRESEEKYRNLFEEGRVARSTTTPGGRFIDVNKEMERMTGYTREELYAANAEILYANPKERDKYIAKLERDSYVRDYELQFKKKDGTLIDCMITSSVHPAGDGGENLIQGTIHDVTERKRMEAKLKEVQKMEVIGRIASGVAHEVRNPLNAILAISEALSKELGDQEVYKPYMEHICTQVDRLATLMNDLLDLGKPLKTTEFSPALVSDICAGAVHIWHQGSAEGEFEVTFADMSGGVPLQVFGNSNKLKQVILDLIENATQHSPKDGKIEVKLLRGGNGKIIIRLTDQGAGVPPEILSEVFKPFFTTRARGSGLGLSIVKNIIEMHGGTIELINNDPPPGLTAEIILPLFEDVKG